MTVRLGALSLYLSVSSDTSEMDFKVALERAPGKADIDFEFRPEYNRYLIVHEGSGLDSRASDSQDLQAIQAFISRRTDVKCTPPERVHAIW